MIESEEYKVALQRAARLIAGAGHLIAFTGAGASADSGVPTFRGQGGLWGKYDERHLELATFLAEPESCWPTIHRIFYEQAEGFQPNAAHRVLAEWERDGILDFLITQNIDGLHGRAGSKRVAEFHGSCERLCCLRCGASVAAGPIMEAMRDAGGTGRFKAPRCTCGGLYKPGFVFFGEGIPEAALSSSFEAAERADACLVIGSTGTVFPAARIPRRVRERGYPVIEINPESSDFTDDVSELFIGMGAADAMTALDALVRDAR